MGSGRPRGAGGTPGGLAQFFNNMVVVVMILVGAAVRFPSLSTLPMNWDEVWSVWQTLGTFEQTLVRTPDDWPPLYFLSVHLWGSAVGITPFVMRLGSMLVFLLGTALAYRALFTLTRSRTAAVSGAMAFTALGFAQFLSIVVRAYVPLLMLSMAALWLTARWWRKPTMLRALQVGLCLLIMFYTHYTAVFVALLLGALAFLMRPRAAWHWWLPALMLIAAAAIEVAHKPETFATRSGANVLLQLPPLPEALIEVYAILTRGAAGIILLIGLAIAALIVRRNRALALTAVVWAASPLMMYVLQPRLGLFQDVR